MVNYILILLYSITFNHSFLYFAGFIPTSDFMRHASGFIKFLLRYPVGFILKMKGITSTVDEGGDNLVLLAADPSIKGLYLRPSKTKSNCLVLKFFEKVLGDVSSIKIRVSWEISTILLKEYSRINNK